MAEDLGSRPVRGGEDRVEIGERGTQPTSLRRGEPTEHLREVGCSRELVPLANAATLGGQGKHDGAAIVGVRFASDQALTDQYLNELRDRAGAQLELLRNEPGPYRLVADD